MLASGCWLLCYLGTITAYLSTTPDPEVREYCQEESFTATCQPNQVIQMESAVYGRPRLGRCVKRNLGYLGCQETALHVLDTRCGGHTSCEVSIMDTTLRDLNPCAKDVTWHLFAAFRCVDVAVGSSYDCQTKKHSPVRGHSGYLSSLIAAKTSIGSSSCPWRIHVDPGQRVNITLYNFVSALSPKSTTGEAGSAHPLPRGSPTSSIGGSVGSQGGGVKTKEVCYDVAVIREGTAKRSVAACRSEQRMRSVYVSTGSVVDVEFSMRSSASGTKPSSSVQFLIYYEVLGCVTLTPPVGATVTREKDTLVFKCNVSGDTWSLICDGSKWTGTMSNCSIPANHVWNSDDLFSQPGFPLGILIVVAVGVALGVFLGGTLLLLASMLMRRQRFSQRNLAEGSGIDDLKSSDDFDYTDPGAREDRNPKHYIVQNYVPKEFVPVTNECPGFDTEYSINSGVSRERVVAHAGLQKTLPDGLHQTSPRILYHVYESPQLT